MTINKIYSSNDPQKIINERMQEATSGKKNSIHQLDKTQARDASQAAKGEIVVSEDAKKLQETEVILRNALQKLHEMDEINEESLGVFTNKVKNEFYDDNDDVTIGVADLILPEEQMRRNISIRFKAEEYVDDVKEFDREESDIDYEKIEQVKARIANGYYNQENVVAEIADNLLEIMI
ncbi:MAG TPA: flagellar biosynthesis anti-sigma factor FlgM [Candidatus Cloacimonadota bacterium]|jgi:hypothetical protein|nr:flagellar biosynthesis anti-sigma factor FlgM [Candidatus Cloacimonadales bacterium]HOE90976.1 flagellar biosynthesis anti-sigma factor FlgM [Candidatus Cloacimonadota bacterium]HOQ79530.1 flagellar biosynthesis anti-sigma factor FlgM [Candidatus Cloacimonadota bacterium]HPK40379.1 flagellar biosynthesis anti-sigma factor FlgM [Candidatus Cloacimonadota bacterium]HPY96241.1 flagellar biosynthesis anti-sigma factor FlgM [Candidatus Cloacimonadota bacterium]